MIESPTAVTPRAITSPDDQPRRRRRRGILALLLGLTTISLGAGMFSLAIFTDSAASTGTFASGTIDITSSPTVAFNVSNMVPGDTNTQALTIANAGTASLRYAMTADATNALGTELTLTVKTVGTSCADLRRYVRPGRDLARRRRDRQPDPGRRRPGTARSPPRPARSCASG